MEKTLSIARAKARFAECVRHAERGGALVLTRHGRPVARLTPIEAGPAAGPALETAGEVREVAPGYGSDRSFPVSISGPTSGPAAAPESRREALERLLEESIWPRVPRNQLDAGIEKREREKILGYGSDGV